MSYEDLLRQRIIEPVEVSPEEIVNLFKVAQRDIKTSKNLIDSDLDWAFSIAYNAILQISLAYMNSLGYRPRGEAKHANTFRFLSETLPKTHHSTIKRLQRMRQKRNATIYRRAGLVSEKEAKDIIGFTNSYYELIKKLLPAEIRSLL